MDLAVYADLLAAEAAALAARLERERSALRQAAIEHEARAELPAATVARLERLGLLGARASADEDDLAETHASLVAVGELQAWVEARLACGNGSEPLAAAVPPAGA